ncbi:MAG: tetratricopeptide repeat protein [Planctomycetaceae bacterium]|nr:tetratricopeptide repeat protein [Planctomycetaceae bacterium]
MFLLHRFTFILAGAWLLAWQFAAPVHAQRRTQDLTETISLADAERTIRESTPIPTAYEAVLDPNQPVTLWTDRGFLGIDNAYSEDGIRYVVFRLTVLNRTDQDLTITRDQIQLDTGEKEIGCGERPAGFRGMPLGVDREILPQSRLRTPDTISVPAKQATSCWCVFAGVAPLPISPPLRLSVAIDDLTKVELDIRREQELRLGLSAQRLGPQHTLALLTIQGHLNTLNANVVAQRLEQEFAANTRRVLIAWGEHASPCDEILISWLLSAATGQRDDPLYLSMPVLAPIPLVRLAALPEANREAELWDESNGHIDRFVEDAAVAMLSDIFNNMDQKRLVTELLNGHPLSQQAALRIAGKHCGVNALPTLIRFARHTQASIRHAAYAAIAQQADSRGIEFLKDVVLTGKPGDREAAISAMIAGNQIYISEILHFLEMDEPPVPLEKLIPRMRVHYRPEWKPILETAVSSDRGVDRLAALEALEVLRHPRLEEICLARLEDPQEDVSRKAFEILIQWHTRSRRPEVLSYALKQLEQKNFDETILRFIESQKNPRAAPLILALILSKSSSILRLIDVLAEIGSDDDVRRLIANDMEFDGEVQAAIIRLAGLLSVNEQIAIAREAAESKHFAVRFAAMELLLPVPEEFSLPIYKKLLEQANDDELELVSDTIGEMGTPKAIHLLRDFRHAHRKDKDAPWLFSVIDRSIRIGMTSSPGWDSVESGRYHWRIEEWEEAVKNLSLAIELDPELSVAYSWRANCLMKLQKFEQAQDDFAKAWELDPYDGQAATGLGITMAIAGDWKKAIEMTETAAEKFPEDYIYAYNTACVYGRALESLNKASGDHQEDITEISQKGLRKLQESVELGFDDMQL